VARGAALTHRNALTAPRSLRYGGFS
jgi:hypothetical protein